jgi:hypothetical protein
MEHGFMVMNAVPWIVIIAGMERRTCQRVRNERIATESY